MACYTDEPHVLAAAVLHNMIDCGDLCPANTKHLFGSKVYAIVLDLYEPPDKIGRIDYLIKKIDDMDDSTLLIKLADTLEKLPEALELVRFVSTSGSFSRAKARL